MGGGEGRKELDDEPVLKLARGMRIMYFFRFLCFRLGSRNRPSIGLIEELVEAPHVSASEVVTRQFTYCSLLITFSAIFEVRTWAMNVTHRRMKLASDRAVKAI